MKTIISTKKLSDTLNKALKDKSFNRIDFKYKEWIFNRSEKSNLTIDVDYVNQNFNTLESIEIDRMKWYKISEFLKILPEQPIVLEIDFFTDDIKIRLSQFIADF
jgi:hypothetical protein